MKTFKANAKKLKEGMQVEVNAAGFKMIFDEPEQMGGTNQGVNPMSASLGVMGACQTIVAFMFAKQKGIELEDFSVEIEGDMNMEALMKQNGERTGFSEIRYKMHFKANNTEKELEEFSKFIEENCPVSDTMKNGSKLVNTGIVKE
ncbi:MAG: OsmC family protein [Candidatus Izemoplasmatales bacterium]|uniref:OsmC family protein n=1 Tax=Hujiaoplasma nucleasis TaxID=2725268 RepID=A0A7L6N2Y9_9MOLU|nr:OsmC family protein [Hujiaoplasma nucleasis]QLY39911.1 OsmC family protein [Hujiaoplasma nucleasis]